MGWDGRRMGGCGTKQHTDKGGDEDNAQKHKTREATCNNFVDNFSFSFLFPFVFVVKQKQNIKKEN